MMPSDTELENIAKALYHAADCIQYYIRVSAFHDCNDCGMKACQYRPKPGQTTRINCPLWTGKEGG